MKRTIVVVLVLAALAAVYVGNRAPAQPPAPMSYSATKIGLANIGYIFQKYYKVKVFREQFERELKPYNDKRDELMKIGKDWEAALKNPTLDVENRTKGEKTILEVKHRLEDLKLQYQKQVAKRTEEQLIQLYSEVNEAISKYAAPQGFSLVLGYGEPTDGNLLTFVNVTRKMQAMDGGAVVPMYAAGSMDISQPVVNMLNALDPGPGPAPRPAVPGITTGGGR